MNHDPLKIDVRILERGISDRYMKRIPILTDEKLECGYVEWSLFNNLEEQGHRYPEIAYKIPSQSIWPLALIEFLEVSAEYQGQGHGRKGLRSAIIAAEQAGAVFVFLRVSWNETKEDPGAEYAWKIRHFQSEGFKLADRNNDEPVLMYRPLRLNPLH